MEIASKIKTFFENNEQAKTLKKILDPLNTEIKDYFRTAKEKMLAVDDIVAVYTIQERNSINQDALLKLLKKIKRKDLIKKIEVPDTEKIETLIYNQELDATILTSCMQTQHVEVLKISRKKKEKTKENEDGEN